MTMLLLESGKEGGLVFPHGPAGREAEDVVGEDRLLNSIQLVHVRNRIESLRLVTPEDCAVQIVSTGLRNYIEHAAAGTPELYAEVAGLNGDFRHCIGNGERLLLPGQPDIIVISPVQHEVIASWALAVDRELSIEEAAGDGAARGIRGAGQSPGQRDRIESRQRQIANLARLEVSAPK